MSATKKECFIIGSGSSLLDLTTEEKDYLNNHPHTLAMNKYLLFYEKIGVIPKALFLGDFHFPAHKVFLETIEKAKQINPQPIYYVDDYYQKLFKEPWKYWKWNLKERYKLYKKSRYLSPLMVNYSHLKFFSAKLRDHPKFIWAKTFEDDLFFQRGSLTTAINLAYLIYPECDIKLLGIDLNKNPSFYEKEIKQRSDLTDHYNDKIARKGGCHATVVKTPQGTVLDKFPLIQKELSQQGTKLLCCTPDSLVVTSGLCDYAPIMK
ncbi:MAG: hypothetical protein QNJ42_11105 [Crocosphaera sp.]|nr:hypothetical protein [Crocosphaera sp.]